MTQKDPSVLSYSKDPAELVKMARRYAASSNPQDQDVLFKYLDSRDFLQRLNTDEEYMRYPARNLDVAAVVKTLMDQNTPEARNTLVNLTESAAFQSHDPLIELNIRALASDIPASPRTIVYWHKHSHPESVYSDVVVEVIFVNRSLPALELFEQMMNDPNHGDDYKALWLRDPMLRKRNDLLALQCCERMIINGTVHSDWHNAILEALFDFNENWYLTCKKPNPGLRVLAPDDSKQVLGRIGKHALTVTNIFIPGLRLKIKNAMKEIGYDWESKEDPAPVV